MPLTDNKNKGKKEIVVEKEDPKPNNKRTNRSTNRKMNLPAAQRHDTKKYDNGGGTANLVTNLESIAQNSSESEMKVRVTASEERSAIIENIKTQEVVSKVLTPTAAFKTREGIRTPLSGLRALTPKRISLTPNPQNFLRKVEDPIAQRIDSPKPELKQSQSNVPKSAIYFHELVEKEERKFKLSCDMWNEVIKEGSAPETVHGDILAAIGQALLFQNKRFKQFKELIELHKDKSAEKAAYASDLDGFWDMIYIQVEDVHTRFAELELWKSNNWEGKKVEPILKKTINVKKINILKVNNTKNEPLKIKKPAVSKFKMFKQQMMAKKEAEKQCIDIC